MPSKRATDLDTYADEKYAVLVQTVDSVSAELVEGLRNAIGIGMAGDIAE